MSCKCVKKLTVQGYNKLSTKYVKNDKHNANCVNNCIVLKKFNFISVPSKNESVIESQSKLPKKIQFKPY